MRYHTVRPYRKAAVAVAGILTAVGVALANGSVSTAEVGTIASAVAVALGVFFAPNDPEV